MNARWRSPTTEAKLGHGLAVVLGLGILIAAIVNGAWSAVFVFVLAILLVAGYRRRTRQSEHPDE